MDAHGMAALLEVIGDLRSTIDEGRRSSRRHDRIAHDTKVEGYWEDLSKLLDDDRQSEVARFDRWLAHIDEALAVGGDTVKLIDLGMKVADRRSRVLALDARTVIHPRLTFVAEIVDAELGNERVLEELENESTED